MNAHVAVLASAGVAPSVRPELDGVDGAKVALHPGKLLLKHHVEEAGVKLADPGGRGRHVHGLLTAAQHDMVRQRAEAEIFKL